MKTLLRKRPTRQVSLMFYLTQTFAHDVHFKFELSTSEDQSTTVNSANSTSLEYFLQSLRIEISGSPFSNLMVIETRK